MSFITYEISTVHRKWVKRSSHTNLCLKRKTKTRKTRRTEKESVLEIQEKNNIFTDYVKSTYMDTMWFFSLALFVLYTDHRFLVAFFSCLVCGLSIGRRIFWIYARFGNTNKNQINFEEISWREWQIVLFLSLNLFATNKNSICVG